MRKEVIASIVAGIAVGVVLAFGIWRANSALKPKNQTTTQDSIVNPPTPTLPEFKIILTNLSENDVVVTSPLALSGISPAGSWIAISGESEDYILKSDASGAFEVKTDLAPAVNQILINAVNDGVQTQQKLTVIFSSEFAKELTNEGAISPEPSPEIDAVREKIKEKVEMAKKKPTAILGTITDKLQESLQVKNGSEEIKLISINSETTSFVKLDKSSSSVKFNDLAIGDFIIAMGFTNGSSNGVLTARRVIVTAPPPAVNRKIVFGEITSIEKKVLSLTDIHSNEWGVEFPARWKGPEIKELSQGDKVALVFEEKEKRTIRTILKID